MGLMVNPPAPKIRKKKRRTTSMPILGYYLPLSEKNPKFNILEKPTNHIFGTRGEKLQRTTNIGKLAKLPLEQNIQKLNYLRKNLKLQIE